MNGDLKPLYAQVQENTMEIRIVKGMLVEQSKAIDRISKALIGDGSKESVVARLLLAEERQKEAADARESMSVHIESLEECVARLEKQSEKDSAPIAMIPGIDETVKSWKNKIVGISMGAGAATGVIMFLLFILLERVIGGGTP